MMFQLAWPYDYIQCGLTRFRRPKPIAPNRLTVPSIRTTKTVGDPPCTNQIIPTIDGGRVHTADTQKSTPSNIPRCHQKYAPRSESKPRHDYPNEPNQTLISRNRLDNSRKNRNSTTRTHRSKHEASAGRYRPGSTPSPMRGG